MTRELALELVQRAIYDGKLDRRREESNLADLMMAAISQEREKCAAIAESIHDGGCACGEDVAIAIRSHRSAKNSTARPPQDEAEPK